MTMKTVQNPTSNTEVNFQQVNSKRELTSFRRGNTTPSNVLELRVRKFSVFRGDGEFVDSPIDLVASYQKANLEINCDRIITAMKTFASKPIDVVSRISSIKDIDDVAKKWLMKSLTHALLNVPGRFWHGNVEYITHSSSETFYAKMPTHDSFQLRLPDYSPDSNNQYVPVTLEDSYDATILLNSSELIPFLKRIKEDLRLTVSNGTVIMLGQPIRRWTYREPVKITATEDRIPSFDDII